MKEIIKRKKQELVQGKRKLNQNKLDTRNKRVEIEEGEIRSNIRKKNKESIGKRKKYEQDQKKISRINNKRKHERYYKKKQ